MNMIKRREEWMIRMGVADSTYCRGESREKEGKGNQEAL